MQPWTQFYATIGTAAAALLGLLFVVVSTNVSVALGPTARPLTEQAFQNYLTVMLMAFLTLFPGITTTTFGIVALVTSAASSVWVAIRFYQTLALHMRRGSWVYPLRRHLSSLIGFGILIVSALRMALNWGTSYNWFAASTLILLFSATEASWGLLKRIGAHSSR